MPIFRSKNEHFFKQWSPEMAYVLGFFCADGCIFTNPRGSCYLAFYSTDREILEKIKRVMGVSHVIGTRSIRPGMKKVSYCLQIGSRGMYEDLRQLGLTENKSCSIELPAVPEQYLPDFVRGYFDGDGNVTVSTYYRKDRESHVGRTMLTGFTSGSRKFLQRLRVLLTKVAGLGLGTLYFASRGHRLCYSVRDSRKLYEFMYNNQASNSFLTRKQQKFLTYKSV
ncbi:MAG: hypothetical protein HY471_01325 [Candidatus Sungbacteria bacterium]|nr:hypothetical protein [Candidatus Sungbacteria bacterium]